MSAAALLAEARAGGIGLRLADGKPKVSGNPSPELLARLRAHKPELIEILRGDRCRRCAERLAWPAAAGITFADATSECMACADREAGRLLAAGQRAVESVDALADPAEVMLRGELT